jgi:hypothetical protein
MSALSIPGLKTQNTTIDHDKKVPVMDPEYLKFRKNSISYANQTRVQAARRRTLIAHRMRKRVDEPLISDLEIALNSSIVKARGEHLKYESLN